MKIHNCQQRSDEWHDLRLGRITASHFADVLNKKTGRETYMWDLIRERRKRERKDSYESEDMRIGTLREPEARDYYQFITDDEVVEVGFVELSKDVGCSPDGLVGKDGLLELKCPKLTTHWRRIIKNVLPSEYKPQVQGQIWVCEKQWCDFASFNPEHLEQPMWIIRVERDHEYIERLSAACATFIVDMETLERKLNEAA